MQKMFSCVTLSQSRIECRRFEDEIWILRRRVCESYPSHPSRAFPVMFCTVNEEFAMSWDGSWRCIHAWERRRPSHLATRVSKNKANAQVLCRRCRGNAPSMGTRGPEENFGGGTARPLAHTSCCRNIRIEPLKPGWGRFRGNSRDREFVIVAATCPESRVKQSRLKYRGGIVEKFLKQSKHVLYNATI